MPPINNMNPNQEIISELQKINQKIDNYIHPLKRFWVSFLNGTFYALGAIFGTLIIAYALIYVFSQFNFTASVSKWIETTMSQINWTKVIAPQTQIIQEKQ